jgi:hypothetical protein
LVALTLVGLAASGCADQSAAVQVGGQTVSESDLFVELRTVGDDERLLQFYEVPSDAVAGDVEGSFSQEFVGIILTHRISLMLQGLLLDDEGLELGAQERETAERQIRRGFAEAGGDVDELPDGYYEQFVDDYATEQLVRDALGPGLRDALVELAQSTDIRVSSRYGRWDAVQLAIVPPEAPEPAPGSDDEAEPAEGP